MFLVAYSILLHEFYPPTMDLFYGNEDVQFSKRVSNVEVVLLFNIPQVCVVALNTLAKLYSMWLKCILNKRHRTVRIFLVLQDNREDSNIIQKQEGYALSINYVLAIIMAFPLLFLFSQFSDHYSRLYFVEPTFLMIICCILPLCIVLKHKKMRNILVNFFPKLNIRNLFSNTKQIFTCSSSAIHPG